MPRKTGTVTEELIKKQLGLAIRDTKARKLDEAKRKRPTLKRRIKKALSSRHSPAGKAYLRRGKTTVRTTGISRQLKSALSEEEIKRLRGQ